MAKLLGSDWDKAFDAGQSSRLLQNRNRHLGMLLACEQSPYYIQILYRMLRFRRDHEIEPLNDDIYQAVKTAQEQLAGEEYSPEKFNQQINQLLEWKLISRRIEKERLKGYRDASRNKFRYALEDDTCSFLNWLEERMEQDISGSYDDTRNLLDDVLARLRGVIRELIRIDCDYCDEDALTRIRMLVYHFEQIDDLSARISRRLIGLNARLSAFLVSHYSIEEATKIIAELEFYLKTYLRQLNESREDILSAIEELSSGERLKQLRFCRKTMLEEQKRTSLLLRSGGTIETPETQLRRMSSFYENEGQLDRLCHRINDSAMKVWGKMSAHLRELERKNTRLENLRCRLEEIAELPENAVPESFLLELLAPAHMVGDKQYWDEFEKADPPQPRRETGSMRTQPRSFLGAKSDKGKPVQSLEESRLEMLRGWINLACRFNDRGEADIARMEISAVEDFMRVLELGRRGILTEGKTLRKLDYQLKTGRKMKELVSPEGRKLEFIEMKLVELKNGKNA